MEKEKPKVDVGNANVVPRSDYTQTLEEIIAGGFCPFCEEHLFKHHRRRLLHRSDFWIVTENSWPYEGSRFHILFIARKHIEKTEDVSAAMWVDLLSQYRKFVKERKIKRRDAFYPLR